MNKQNLQITLVVFISLNTLSAFVIKNNIPRQGTHWNRIGKRFDSTNLSIEKSMETNLDFSYTLMSKNTFCLF